jgi:two-component system chemotaxis response regulator CheB
MPELDGVAALPLILAKRPTISVIVVSTLTRRNAALSLKCLALGATDYLAKPESNREVTTSADFRAELKAKLLGLEDQRLRRVRGLARSIRWPNGPSPDPASPRAASPVRDFAGRGRPHALLIGASTGGPRAIGEVLAGLGSSLSQVPVLIVQHMPPLFTTAFAEILTAQAGVPAREGEDGERVEAGRIYVAPGGRHMGLAREAGRAVIRVTDGPRVGFCRPAVDVLFRDAASVYGPACAALVLTGMGTDGVLGARALVDAGAGVFVQDEATSTIWGMPGSVARAGLARGVLPLSDIAPAMKDLIAGVRA